MHTGNSMMKMNLTKRAVSLATAFLMVFCLIAMALPVSAAGSLSANPTVVSGSLDSGSSSDIIVYFTHIGYTGSPATANVTAKPSGGLSFSGGAQSVSVSSNDGTLTYQITIEGATYDGVSNAGVRFDVTYDDGSTYTTSATVPVKQDPENNTPPPPTVIAGNLFNIVEGTSVPEIDAGTTKKITYPISSSKRISGDVQISAELPEKMYFTTASSTQTMSFIRTGSQDYTIQVSADSSLASGTYPVTLHVRYKYSNEAKDETITTYVKVNGNSNGEQASDLVITGYTMKPESVQAGSDFELNVTVRNDGDKVSEETTISLGGSALSTESLTMNGTLDSMKLDPLQPGQTMTYTFYLCSNKKMATGNYILDATIGEGETAAVSKIFVPVIGNPEEQDEDGKKTESTPQLIIESYTYGEEGAVSVTGGEIFTLSTVIRNTGKTAVKNVKITVSSAADTETGGAFSPANSSNTFYIENIPAGGTITESLDLLPKADAKPKSYGIDFAFSYEAIVNDELVTKEVTQTIAIPLTQPDRFEVAEPQMYGPVYQGETLNGYVSYVNKGKSTIFNLSMKIEGEGFTTAEAETYIGNVESGASDGYDISLNPQQAGPLEGTITFTYEDANGDTKEIVKNFQTEVMEYVEPEIPEGAIDPNMPVEAEGGMPVWGWALIAVGGAVVLVVIIVVVRKVIRKKKQAALDAEDDYDEDTGE